MGSKVGTGFVFKSVCLPVSVCEVTAKLISKVVIYAGMFDIAYLEMSSEAFSPTFMVVTPSSQPVEYQWTIRIMRNSSRA